MQQTRLCGRKSRNACSAASRALRISPSARFISVISL
jgi:hypothetical protein